MFNVPRSSPSQYTATNGFPSVFVNSLTASVYSDGGDNEADPWASATVVSSPVQHSALGNVLGDASVPAIYLEAFDVVEPTGSGEVSLGVLIRVLRSSQIPAPTIDKIVNIVSSKPRVSRLEFHVALALVGLAQEGQDVSIEQVAHRAQSNSLPQPTLDLATFRASATTLLAEPPNSLSISQSQPDVDPWRIDIATTLEVSQEVTREPRSEYTVASLDAGLGRRWWKHQRNVEVAIIPEKQGFILARYTAYLVTSDRNIQVTRRYSEFAFLFDCLVRRYPFRIIPSLPPKRLGGDSGFLEQRRKGLKRWLSFVINHPVLREDGLLTVFLTETSLEAWRKHTSISLEEESSTRFVDRVDEMRIPSDLDNRITIVRDRLPALIDRWTRICFIAERILKRSEASVSDLTRLTMALSAFAEEYPQSWRAEDDELYDGVMRGLRTTSCHLTVLTESSERRVRTLVLTSLEALKTQRDLYIATHDLFSRRDRLSGDQVDQMKRRIKSNALKLEAIKQARKDGWVIEADKVTVSIELDQGAITSALSRRVFIRYCVWHELRVVLYNRENTLLTQVLQDFARDEGEFSKVVASGWMTLADELQTMPLE